MNDTFETFIEDESNRSALTALKAVAGNLTKHEKTLWLYGPPGCGKSHLLRAVFQTIQSKQQKDAVFLSANVLAQAMIEKICNERIRKKDETEVWRRIENTDVLIIDNLEYLKGKTTTQEEIARLYTKKQSENKQIIIASDCPPVDLPVLERILRERTETTLFSEILLPGNELKQKYIEKFLIQNPNLSNLLTEDAKALLKYRVKTILQLSEILQTEWSFNL